jgi:uncharacterized membrane protein
VNVVVLKAGVASTNPAGSPEGSMLLYLKQVIEYLARGVEFCAALIIAIAALEATIGAFILFSKPRAPPQQKNEVRLTLGRWLAVALEFELAADILKTAVTPTWNEIGKLAAIATLRTALNFFLQRDIDQESKFAQIDAARTSPATSVDIVGKG